MLLWDQSSPANRVACFHKKIVRIICFDTEITVDYYSRKNFIYSSSQEIHKSKSQYTHTNIPSYSTHSAHFITVLYRRRAKSGKNSSNISLYNHIPSAWKNLNSTIFKNRIKALLIKTPITS